MNEVEVRILEVVGLFQYGRPVAKFSCFGFEPSFKVEDDDSPGRTNGVHLQDYPNTKCARLC